jgi:cyclohexanone monooxygenase
VDQRLHRVVGGAGVGTIEASPEATAAWTDHVQDVAAQTLFPKAASWYMGANIPGKKRLFLPYIGGVGNYRDKCTEVAADGYEGFNLTPGRHAAPAAWRPNPRGANGAR